MHGHAELQKVIGQSDRLALVEGGCLENRYPPQADRGFESHPHRKLGKYSFKTMRTKLENTNSNAPRRKRD